MEITRGNGNVHTFKDKPSDDDDDDDDVVKTWCSNHESKRQFVDT